MYDLMGDVTRLMICMDLMQKKDTSQIKMLCLLSRYFLSFVLIIL